MIHDRIHESLSDFCRLATGRIFPSSLVSRPLALGVLALTFICSSTRAEGRVRFDRGPAERQLSFGLPDSPLVGLLNFVSNQGDFLRVTPDGTPWLHGFDRDANMYLGLPLVDWVLRPEDMIVLFAGTGRFTWFDIVTFNTERGGIDDTDERLVITSNFTLVSTAAAQELLGIPEGTDFKFQARVVLRDGEAKLFDIIFEPAE